MEASIFRKCLFAGIISGSGGIILEVTNALGQHSEMTLVIMFIPLIYIGSFQLFRWVFKRLKGTEPHVTSAISTVGAPPLDMDGPSGKDGKLRKYPRDREIMPAEFVFRFAQAQIPILRLWF